MLSLFLWSSRKSDACNFPYHGSQCAILVMLVFDRAGTSSIVVWVFQSFPAGLIGSNVDFESVPQNTILNSLLKNEIRYGYFSTPCKQTNYFH